MEIKVFVFSVEDFNFLDFMKADAKPDKHNFKRSLSMTFEVRNS